MDTLTFTSSLIGDILSWRVILLIIIFILRAPIRNLINSVQRFAFKGAGFTVDVETTVHNFENDLNKVDVEIDEFVNEEYSTDKIRDVVEYSFEQQPRDTWSKLLLIRVTLRRLLRTMVRAQGVPFDDDPTVGIRRMTRTLAQKGVIDQTLEGEVERIRDATFKVEWGDGRPPDPKDVRFTLVNYANVFARLKKRMPPT